ncbi:MAG: DNA-directed RNA polymerase subunit K [Methanobrevibacter sp.]|nr:DNA-directed RNA polymerase subunit K [Methanobrevibacter sp.]
MAAEETVSKKLTRFEKARVLGARAIQLSLGAKPMKHKEIDKLLKNDDIDSIDIATKELELGILPLNVKPKE